MENKEVSTSWWGKKSPAEKRHFIYVCSVVVIGVLCLVFVLFGKQIFGFDLVGNSEGTAKSLATWFAESSPLFLHSILTLLIGAMFIRLLDLIKKGIGTKNKKAATIYSIVRSFLKWFIILGMIFRILQIWGVDVASIVAGLGIVALIVGLGCKTLVADVVAGIFLVSDEAYQVGDIVYIDGFRGVVQEIGLRSTKILDDGGDLKLISNSNISEAVNLSEDYSIASYSMNVDYRDDLKRTEAIIAKGLPEIKKETPAIISGPFYKVVSSFEDNGLILKFVAKCKEEDRFQVEREMNKKITKLLLDNDVNIPYPTYIIEK
jgi:small conductance mechanosensitive channel